MGGIPCDDADDVFLGRGVNGDDGGGGDDASFGRWDGDDGGPGGSAIEYKNHTPLFKRPPIFSKISPKDISDFTRYSLTPNCFTLSISSGLSAMLLTIMIGIFLSPDFP